MKIAHIFANDRYEPRGFKLVTCLKKSSYDVQELLKFKNEPYWKFVIRCVKEISCEKPDIIHAHRISGFIPAIITKILGLKVKVIYDKHDIHKYDFIFDKLAALFADYVIVASDLHKKRMRQICKNVEVIHNYSWFRRSSKEERERIRKEIGIKKDDVVILFQGSIVPEYGLHMLLKSVKGLPKKVKILIVGWIKDIKYWNECKKEFNGRVIYIGIREYHEMAKYISASDIGVVLFQKCKLAEYGNPNKLFEFFACKVPVIVTDVLSVSRYVKDGINGFVIKNYIELRDAIKKLISSETRRNFSKNLPNLRWETEFKKYLKVLNDTYEKKDFKHWLW